MLASILLVLCTFQLTSATTTTDGFLTSCLKYFYKSQPPVGFPKQHKYICQRFNGSYYFATLYDTTNKIPVYAAYTIDKLTCTGKQPTRRDAWFIEPQLGGRGRSADMDTDKKSNHDWVLPVQAVNDDFRDTDYDRGHLNPNFMQCDSARTATFTLTNSIPQNGCMNRMTWFTKESKLKALLAEKCSFRNAQRFLLTGAVPSAAKFIPSREEVVEDLADREYERVNVPSHLWTAACCDTSNSPTSSAKSFFVGHIAANEPAGVVEDFSDAEALNKRLQTLYKLSTPLRLFYDRCGDSPSTTNGASSIG